jgi:hypothetical protein
VCLAAYCDIFGTCDPSSDAAWGQSRKKICDPKSMKAHKSFFQAVVQRCFPSEGGPKSVLLHAKFETSICRSLTCDPLVVDPTITVLSASDPGSWTRLGLSFLVFLVFGHYFRLWWNGRASVNSIRSRDYPTGGRSCVAQCSELCCARSNSRRDRRKLG